MKKKQNIMKKALLLVLCLAFFVGCSSDSEISSEMESVDLTKIINPDTARAAAQFDNTANGIYKGVFISTDISYHGTLTVNLGNDSKYNAILVYGDDQRIGFLRVNNNPGSSSDMIEFRGRDAGFTVDVSDYAKPVVTGGYIDGQEAQMKIVKERSANRVTVILGTFADNNDPNYFGTWDFISLDDTFVITVPTTDINLPLPPGLYPSTVDVTVNTLDEVVVAVQGSFIVFTDDRMETFSAGPNCLAIVPSFPTDSFNPFYSGEQTQVLAPLIPGPPTFIWDIDEYATGIQTSLFGGNLATWELNYSYAARTYPNGTEGKYYTEDCIEQAAGRWAWDRRVGTILLTL
jgi:hypothetical protein